MADTLSTGPSIQSHAPKSSQRAAPRLRESCEPCAAAKVRCSKDKPMCTRCGERDLPCVYFATRRFGRPPNKAANGSKTSKRNSGVNQERTCQESAAPGASMGQGFFPTFAESNPVKMPEPLLPDPQNLWLDTSPSSSSSFSTDTMPQWNPRELDDFFASFVSLPNLDLTTPFSEGIAPMDDCTMSGMDLNPPSIQQSHSVGDCSCLKTALGHLSKPESSTGQRRSSAQQSPSPTESLIAENKSIAGSVNDILQCKCAQDSQVLIILALVVSKVLGRYGRAAKATPTGQITPPPQSPQSSTVAAWQRYQMSGFARAYPQGEDSSRAAGQLVLAELHRALKLVNELAARLNEHGNGANSPDWKRRSSSQGSFDEANMVSFSSSMLLQLGADLRDQLQSVVATITGML